MSCTKEKPQIFHTSNTAKAISLSELFFLVSLSSIALFKSNAYSGALASMMVLKQIPERIMKSVGNNYIKKCNYTRDGNRYSHTCKGMDKTILSYVTRPKFATNCNMINSGGNADLHSGEPSGHCSIITFLFITVLLKCIDRRNEGKNYPSALLILLFICQVLIPLARTDLNCHTRFQVLSGMALGITLAVLYRLAEKGWLNNYTRYTEDRDKFYEMFIT